MPRGRIVAWKDDKGYGHIRPAGGGADVFVHISDLMHRGYAPKAGDEVRYAAARDDRGRLRASAVSVAGVPRHYRSAPWSFALIVPAVFFGLLVGTGASQVAVAGYGAMSIATWLAYFLDKRKARADAWRTPESTLQIMAILGGWPGAVVAQQTLRHKTRKPAFQATFWLIVAAHAAFWTFLWVADLRPGDLPGPVLRAVGAA